MRVRRTVAIAAFTGLITTTASAGSLGIHEADFGEEWPFTVAEGELRCSGPKVVTFSAGGVTYAVNGVANAAGFSPIEPIWELDWSMYEEFAKAFGTTIEEAKDQVGPIRINIGPIIDAGLALCGQ